jgi:hypothetical protein
MDEKINDIGNQLLDEAENIVVVGKQLTLVMSAVLDVAGGKEVFLILVDQMGNIVEELFHSVDRIVLAVRDLTADSEEGKRGAQARQRAASRKEDSSG